LGKSWPPGHYANEKTGRRCNIPAAGFFLAKTFLDAGSDYGPAVLFLRSEE
jgi:hypothetical protein